MGADQPPWGLHFLRSPIPLGPTSSGPHLLGPTFPQAPISILLIVRTAWLGAAAGAWPLLLLPKLPSPCSTTWTKAGGWAGGRGIPSEENREGGGGSHIVGIGSRAGMSLLSPVQPESAGRGREEGAFQGEGGGRTKCP